MLKQTCLLKSKKRDFLFEACSRATNVFAKDKPVSSNLKNVIFYLKHTVGQLTYLLKQACLLKSKKRDFLFEVLQSGN